MALVSPNLTVGIDGYTCFLNFLRDGCLNDLSVKCILNILFIMQKLDDCLQCNFIWNCNNVIWGMVIYVYDPNCETVAEIKCILNSLFIMQKLDDGLQCNFIWNCNHVIWGMVIYVYDPNCETVAEMKYFFHYLWRGGVVYTSPLFRQ
jgi:hypothetical protein